VTYVRVRDKILKHLIDDARSIIKR